MNRHHFFRTTCALGIALCGFYFFLTGSPFPLFHIEPLMHPVKVTAIDVDGLVTAEGRKLAIRHIATIPTELPALRDAVRKGVEIDPDGYLIGRLKIHHWCGNDPVRYHLARVNLTSLLMLSGAPTSLPVPEGMIRKNDRALRFRYGEHGLLMDDFCRLGKINSFIQTQQTEPGGAPTNTPSPSARRVGGG